MSNQLRITTIQSELHWESIDQNLNSFAQKIVSLKGKTDLIVLPEMFSTGFTMNPQKVAEPMTGKAVSWMREQANLLQCVITGSFICEIDRKYYNRLVWMTPDGTIQFYDKKHLFTLAGEHKHYEPGTKKLIVEYKGWRICPLICYDLRFPVWARNVEDYDVLIYVANWPKKRNAAWKTLLQARAVENQCYTIGVNRVGTDDNGHEYSGDTMIIDFGGTVLYQCSYVQQIATSIIFREQLHSFRTKLNFLADRDEFNIR